MYSARRWLWGLAWKVEYSVVVDNCYHFRSTLCLAGSQDVAGRIADALNYSLVYLDPKVTVA